MYTPHLIAKPGKFVVTGHLSCDFSPKTLDKIPLAILQSNNDQISFNLSRDPSIPLVSCWACWFSSSSTSLSSISFNFYEYLHKVWIQGNKTKAVKHYSDGSSIKECEECSENYIQGC